MTRRLPKRLYESGAKFTKDIQTTMSPLLSGFLSIILPLIIFIGLGQYISRKFMDKAGGGNALSFDWARAMPRFTFSQQKASALMMWQARMKRRKALQRLWTICIILRNIQRWGASMPKGVLCL